MIKKHYFAKTRPSPGLMEGSFVGDPAGVDCGHVDPVHDELHAARPSHHVESGLGHVRVRMSVAFAYTGELALHRRDVDDELAGSWTAGQKRLQLGCEEKRAHGIHC